MSELWGGRYTLTNLKCTLVPRALLSLVEAHNIERPLRYLDETIEVPPPAPGPPYFKSKVLRRTFGELATWPPLPVLGSRALACLEDLPS